MDQTESRNIYQPTSTFNQYIAYFIMTIKELIKGISLSVVLGGLAFIISIWVKQLDAILLGLIIGMIVGNTIQLPSEFNKGIGYTSSKMLEFSILFLALGVNFNYISKIGGMSFLYVVIVVLIVLLLSVYISRKFNMSGSSTYLVGFGTAICGSSAIAAVAPAISKDKEDIGISLAVVNLIGITGMLALPAILNWLQVGDIRSGLIIGGSLHSVANVAGAGFAMGDEVARISVTVKLARVALLSPALILYSFLIRRHAVKNWTEHFKLPWYVWAFIGITILSSLINIPESAVKLSEKTGKIILTIAMVAIGLKVSFKTLYNSGKKAMLFGLLIFLVAVLLLLGLSSIS